MITKQGSRKKAVIVQSVGGYINTIISMLQGLLLLPFYFKYITYEVYGLYITIVSIVTLTSIVNFGVGTMVMQRISSSYAKKDYKSVVDYFLNSLLVYIVISFIFIFISTILSLLLNKIITIDNNSFSTLYNMYIIVVSTVLITFYNNSFKGFSQALLNPLFSIISTIMSRLIGLCFIVYMIKHEYGIISIPLGLLITEILVCISNSLHAYVLYKKLNIKAQINKNILKDYFTMSPHLFGLIVGNTLSNSSYPLIITTFLGAEMTTAYTIVRRAAEIILQMLNVINASLIGPFSNLVGEGNKKKINGIVTKIITLSFLSGLLFFLTYIVSNKIFVTLWIGDNLALSTENIILIGLSMLVYSMTRLFRSLLFGFNDIKFAAKVILFEGIGFTLISIILIQLFGVVSIPFSLLLISSIVLFLMYVRLLDKIQYQIKYNIWFVLSVILYVFFLLNINFSNANELLNFFKAAISAFVGIFIIEVLFMVNLKRKGYLN